MVNSGGIPHKKTGELSRLAGFNYSCLFPFPVRDQATCDTRFRMISGTFFLLPVGGFNDFFRQLTGHFLVMGKFHGKDTASAGD